MGLSLCMKLGLAMVPCHLGHTTPPPPPPPPAAVVAPAPKPAVVAAPAAVTAAPTPTPVAPVTAPTTSAPATTTPTTATLPPPTGGPQPQGPSVTVQVPQCVVTWQVPIQEPGAPAGTWEGSYQATFGGNCPDAAAVAAAHPGSTVQQVTETVTYGGGQ